MKHFELIAYPKVPIHSFTYLTDVACHVPSAGGSLSLVEKTDTAPAHVEMGEADTTNYSDSYH